MTAHDERREGAASDVHDLPAVDSADRAHVIDRTCWCHPEVRRPLRGAAQIVHNEDEGAA